MIHIHNLYLVICCIFILKINEFVYDIIGRGGGGAKGAHVPSANRFDRITYVLFC